MTPDRTVSMAIPLNRRRALAALALGAAAPATLAGCFGGSSPDSAPPRAPTLNFTPADAARDVNPTTPAHLEVVDGWLQRAALTADDGTVVPGIISRDRTSFTATEPLGYTRTYTWSGSVVGQDGNAVEIAATFRTIAPAAVVNGGFQLADGQTVGVAAPIILQFDAAIPDKAAVERALVVRTTPQVEGGWAWLPDEVGGSRVHWRGREYFPAGTTVRVEAPLYGVDFGDGHFGGRDITLDFGIGRRQVVKAHAPSHRIQVVNDDGVLFDFPCSYGEGDQPRNVTRSGIHVVTEKYADFWMSNPAAGYDNIHERWAVRISNNGEFIHANPSSADAQGNTNVTNGCINLSTEDAEQYFRTAIYGDPVEVTGTSIQLSYADGDIWDWAVDWNEWVAMSALGDQHSSLNLPSTAPATPSTAPTLSGTPTTTPAPTPSTAAPG